MTMKHLFFRHYWWIITTFCGGTIALHHTASGSPDWPLYLTIAATALSAIYFVQKQRLEEMRLFKQIFTECNNRYDALNERLNEILVGDASQQLSTNERYILFDYFNLCGEEYLFYRAGYILPSAWKSWENGIQFYLSNKRIRTLWEQEVETGSYYGLKF